LRVMTEVEETPIAGAGAAFRILHHDIHAIECAWKISTT
jgi:hypothetical protein